MFYVEQKGVLHRSSGPFAVDGKRSDPKKRFSIREKAIIINLLYWKGDGGGVSGGAAMSGRGGGGMRYTKRWA